MPPNSLSFLKYTIPFSLLFFFFFTSSYFAALSTSPSLVWCQNSDLCFMSDDPFCGGVEMVTMVWSRMMNNRRKVLDRDLLVYDHTSWQKIYSMPTEKSAWLGSSTEATVIQASSVMCLDNNTIFVALDVALWEDIAVRFLENFHRLLGKL